MELRYPILVLVIFGIIICYFIFSRKKEVRFNIGSKIANTHYLKNTDYFKRKIREYNVIRYFLLVMFGIAFIASLVLASRLSKVETVNINKYNRDIFLCMDASASVDELNLELVESLKETVDKLQGERFGVSIFNTSSVILVPLTDDYNFVKDILNQIKNSIQANNDHGSYYDSDFFYQRNYIYSGTLEGSETRGSSLIGDGLASCVYGFSNTQENRTKIIIFSTDNDLAGSPLVSLDKAANISKSKGIKVYGIGTKLMKKNNKVELKNAVIKTGGKYYEHANSTVDEIVEDVELTSKSLLENHYETKQFDIPQVPFIILMIAIFSIILFSKKVLG